MYYSNPLSNIYIGNYFNFNLMNTECVLSESIYVDMHVHTDSQTRTRKQPLPVQFHLR